MFAIFQVIIEKFRIGKSSPPLAQHLETGKFGENRAAQYILSLHYRILGRNIRIGHDEIDLVAWDPTDQVLVFFEVKTRSRASEEYRPELGMTCKKKSRIQRAARRWVAQHDFDGGYRIDLLCIAAGQIVDHVRELSWE
ncbi:MAG: YraN family protein [Candidatus Peribacteraceae bacterium]|nr:YraN family protein [Candidatus Peribacteraceae bacterium]